MKSNIEIPKPSHTLQAHVLSVPLADRSYDIIVGHRILAQSGPIIADLLPQKRAIIVSDDTVAAHYLATLTATLEQSGVRVQSLVLPPGEQTKSFPVFAELMENLVELKPERNTTLIALGGGVIGDITGFAASVLLRGVPFIQVPTTLLAQVDSSVGGKTGINLPRGKNLVGSFYQPKLVLADVGLLETLPRRELLAGYAEVVKYGLINDEPFFSWLERQETGVVDGKPELLMTAVLQSCAAKAAIVAEDEREGGKRALLNLGHTFGHALEAETGYGNELLHGEAVAIGMALAFDLSVQMGLCDEADARRVHAHLSLAGLPTSPLHIRKKWDVGRLVAHCQQDKKVAEGTLTFILARGIGKSFICRDVTSELLTDMLSDAISGG